MKIRRLEMLVLVCGILFVAVLVFSFRPGRRPSSGRRAGQSAPSSDGRGQATTMLDGFDFTETVRGKPQMRIKADRTIGYGPGAGLAPDLYAGEKVTLTLYPDDGGPVTVHADRGEYDERTREAKLWGNVRWSDQEDSLAETDEVRFHPSKQELEAPHRVHFTRGSVDLTAPSARYDLHERAVRFSGPIEGSGNGADSGGLSKLTARQGVFRREAGILELETVDGQSRSGDRYAADHLTVKTGSPGGRTEWARGTGNVRGILGTESAPGIAKGSVERQYAAEDSTLAFDLAGKPKTLSLTGSPAQLVEPKRRLTAPRIDVIFEEGRAASAGASGGIRMDGEGGHAEAERGTLGISKAGDAQNVALEGAVRVDSDGRKGDAARAVELDAGGIWLLTGDSARSARVESGGSRLSADRIEIDRPRQQVRGEGHARAVLDADKDRKERTVTFIGDPKRPSYAKADRIVLDDASHLATLSGAASLWQDDSSLFADDITLSDVDKTVNAVQNVRAVMAPDRGPKTAERAPSIVSSRRMIYRDTDRSGRFEGGVVVTRGAGWRATGGESTAWLGKDRGVDCMEISGDVDLVDRAAGRTAKAEKAVDYPKLGKTVLWGAPARVTATGGNQVAGAILTIFDRGGSVEITAPEGGKTETIHRTEKN